MADINSVNLIGRLTREAELKYTASGSPVLTFSIAVNESRKVQDEWVKEVSYFDITLWGKLGESLKQYMMKGKQVAVNGKLRQQRWQDNNGDNRSKIVVIALEVQLLGGQESSNVQEQNYKKAQYTAKQSELYDDSADDFPEDIPF